MCVINECRGHHDNLVADKTIRNGNQQENVNIILTLVDIFFNFNFFFFLILSLDFGLNIYNTELNEC